MWRDRVAEGQVLDRLVEAVRTGESRALVLRGEPGIGKTALMESLLKRVPGWRVSRLSGVQSEMEVPFAGLHQLCAPMLHRLDRIPAQQREALGTVFGLHSGSGPDLLLVGLAVLGLLAESARERPLMWVVDDAQWLDHASVQLLAFVARRLRAESVAMVFAIRDQPGTHELAGLPELVLTGLPDDDARALLGSAISGPVDEQVLDRLIGEARGNPLALLELPRGLSPAELAAGFGPLDTTGLPQHIEESFQRALAPLSKETRALVLVAAVEPTGDPGIVCHALERLGIDSAAAVPAEAAGLVDFGARIRFRHPLVRSAVYRNASVEERHNAHGALAEVTDPDLDPDRRAWHHAQAATGADEAVAAELEGSADRAQARGGLAAAAAFLQRAAELTPDPGERGRRAFAAAWAKHQAGMTNAAQRLASIAAAATTDKLLSARIVLLRAQIAFTVSRGLEAPALLLSAARQLEPLDVGLARETYLDALLAAMFAVGQADEGALREVAEAAKTAPPPLDTPRAVDLLLDGLAVRFTEGYAAGVPLLRDALRAFHDPKAGSTDGLRWLWLARITAGNLWDDETLDTTLHLQLARDAGALNTLPLALTSRIGAHVLVGELAQAAALTEELQAVSDATGIPPAPYGALLLAAWQGRADEALSTIETATADLVRRGEGFGLIVTEATSALLYNSLGRYEDAYAAAEAGSRYPPVMGVEPWQILAELIEAAVRSGARERAVEALTQLTETTQATRTDWALGIEARCRALIEDDESAYQEAIERLSRTRISGELARCHLLYGEWLRRRNSRTEAREQLHLAHEMFATMGMEAFAARSFRELTATGETVRKRSAESPGELTGQEAQVVRLVRDGLSNAEIAARLFISPRTVEWHLGKIFAKLHITSRRQLQPPRDQGVRPG